MIDHIEGELLATNGAFAIVVSRFNELVTRRLLDGAVNTLNRHGVADERITVVWVPGSFEIPLVADKLAGGGRYAAVCCLGAVIQGETTHHEYINHQVAAEIMRAGQRHGVPVLFGVLTCQTMEQALDRAGGKAGNKGSEAALAAIEMVNVLRKLPDGRTKADG
jgi:6,7-dimethyl-8-ribityllumazine synthase